MAELSTPTREALESIADWIQRNEAAFAFGLFADEVTATSVLGTGSAGTTTPPAPPRRQNRRGQAQRPTGSR